MREARDRYQSDPLFHAMVQSIYRFAEQAHHDGNTLTPTELREAAMLAAIMFEERHVRPILMGAYDGSQS